MRQLLIAGLMTLSTLTAYGQAVSVRAEKDGRDADICFYKQVNLKGYMYANLVGRCAWDPAMNGMYLSLTSVGEDPTQDAHRIELTNVRDVKLVQQKQGQLQISVLSDAMNEEGDILQKKSVIYVRSVDAKKGIFSINQK
jgi:hypothetical protein